MRKLLIAVLTAVTIAGLVVTLRAAPLSGAIFTTVADGSEVNFNIYPSKDAVYLDGGPGPQAPQTAAGLPDGSYVFQVTDPPGKTLLSTDPALCRQFTVSAGIITAVVPAGGCEHLTGVDIDHGATTVQLMPYLDTPNNGGVYKAWVTPLANYVAGCATLLKKKNLTTAQALSYVDCGYKGGDDHGFVPSNSKTDNFKVNSTLIREIDTRFFKDLNNNYILDGGDLRLDGMGITWIDPVGGSNIKYSYYDQLLDVEHEAHVEAVEDGTHQIVLQNQPGCTIGDVYSNGVYIGSGPQTVTVLLSNLGTSNLTWFIDVSCQ